MSIFNTFFFSLIAGLLPAVVWLFFWLREDDAHPEPRGYIILTFFYGMLGVPFALLFQLLFNYLFSIKSTDSITDAPFVVSFVVVLVWAAIEEFIKYKAAWHGGLKKEITDEAVDVPIYMISAALGFSALENVMFLVQPFLNGNIPEAIMTAKLRFIGASLVHVASSALVGIFAGYSLFFMKSVRKRYIGVGFILASVLHGLFNLFIIKNSQNSFAGFLLVWLFIILIIVLFERIKRIKVNTINVREKEKKDIN